MTSYLERYSATVMNTFGTPKAVLTHGAGAWLWDAEGKRYLDLLGGIAVNCLGHAHPAIVAAVTDQVATLEHVSNFFATPVQIALGERLAAMAVAHDPGRLAKVFFTNSGTEANEAAFKVTRRTGRTRIIAMEGSFHGRTLGALALTSSATYRDPFRPLPGDVTFVPYGDAAALAEVVDESVAAVILEPLQGENGVVSPPPGFLAQAREITARHGALLWLDEVQTGMGRCGTWLASHPDGITADLVTLAKGLGAGFPIGACIGTGAAADLLGPGSHGSTFAGNPLAARVGLTVVETIEKDGLLERVTALGEHLVDGLMALGHPHVVGVRGRGLLRGVVLADPIGPQVVERAQAGGFIINSPRPNVLRLAPPFIVTTEQLDSFIEALPEFLG